MHVLITGVAGFIGYNLAQNMIAAGYEVTGIDNLNDYYDVNLKKARLAELQNSAHAANLRFIKADLADAQNLKRIFTEGRFTYVIHLAAQAGVRYSLINPASYISSNLTGFANLLEQCRLHAVEHLIYASSSSVYGLNEAQPYSCRQNVDHPVSLYAATKKSNELMSHSYSHIFGLPCTGLRFFTVYGPWGRPDMALSIFTSAILRGEPIQLFNNGDLQRDFTYIGDIVKGIMRIIDKAPVPDPAFDPSNPDPASSSAPWRVYNIGSNRPISLEQFVCTIEKALGERAIRSYLPMQACDVKSTLAEIDDFCELAQFRPETSLEEGISSYVQWHRKYYGKN